MYRLRPLKKKLLPAPGQFIYVRRGFWSEEHPFSVASYSKKTGEITIATKRFGKYTQKLSELEKGATVSLDGPYGVFTQEIPVTTERPVTLIAGGIGLTPFMQHVLNSQRKDITMFNANRTKDSVIVRGLLQKALGKRYIDIFSDEPSKGAESGRLDQSILEKYLGDSILDQQYYVCGPPPMMNGVKKMLLEAGVPPAQIHTEEFSL